MQRDDNMFVNIATKQSGSVTYIAVLFIDDVNGGVTVAKKTIEYETPDYGKYWGTLKACKLVLKTIEELVADKVLQRNQPVKVIIPSSVFVGWMEKGKAVEPYRYGFDKFMSDCEYCPCELEFVIEKRGSINRAKHYACEKYVPKETYQNFLEAYANM